MQKPTAKTSPTPRRRPTYEPFCQARQACRRNNVLLYHLHQVKKIDFLGQLCREKTEKTKNRKHDLL